MTSREDLLRVPKDLVLKQILFTVLVWFVSSIKNITVFFLQNGKDAISNGQIILGLLFIILYYVKNPIFRFVDSFVDVRSRTNKNYITKCAEERSIEVFMEVGENVSCLNTKTRSLEKMPPATITTTIREYLSKSWERNFCLFDSVTKLFSSAIVVVGLWKVAMVEIEQLTFFAVLLLFSCIPSVYKIIQQKKRGKEHAEKSVDTRNFQKNTYQNLLNIIPLNEEHAKFLQIII